MTPFSTNNPLVKTVVFIAHTFGKLPSELYAKLFDTPFTPEEALVIDSEALAVLAEQSRMASGQYDSESERLKSRWAVQDAAYKREMSKRQKQIDKVKYSIDKPLKRR